MTDGTPIGGKSHTSPLVGSEKVPLSPDGFATTQEIADLGGGGGWIYGDGSDGALVLHDGDTWAPGFYTDVTIEAGATVRVAVTAFGWPICRCTGTFTINGTLDLTGADASGRDGGGGTFAGFINEIGTGANATQDQGAEPTGQTGTFVCAADTPVGGPGGDGLDDNAFAGAPQVVLGYPVSLGPRAGNLFGGAVVNGPLGGSSGGGDGVNYGGAGGAGGDWLLIVARHIVHGPNNLYLLNGGAGAPGGDDGTGATGNGDCGGGGGGGGGYWVTISDTIDDQPAYITTVGNTSPAGTGGLGGAGCGVGIDGGVGDDGFGHHLLNRAS